MSNLPSSSQLLGAERSFIRPDAIGKRRTCRICRKVRSLSRFPLAGKSRSWICRKCDSERREHYWVDDFGAVRSCPSCGKKTTRIIRGLCKCCYERQRHHEMAKFNDSVYGRTSGDYHAQRHRRAMVSQSRLRLRREVIAVYGGKCACCGERRWDCLTIDHANKNGKEEEARLGGGGYILYRDLRRRGFPQDGYRLLCMNCNSSLGHFGYCPHQCVSPRHNDAAVMEGQTQNVRYRATIKMEVIRAYGGRCVVCGVDEYEFLTVDHVMGGGAKDRECFTGLQFYLWLRRNGFPRNDYRLLCFNCNHALGVHQHSVGRWQRGSRGFECR